MCFRHLPGRRRARRRRARRPPGPAAGGARGLGRGWLTTTRLRGVDLAARRDRQLPRDRGRHRPPARDAARPGAGERRRRASSGAGRSVVERRLGPTRPWSPPRWRAARRGRGTRARRRPMPGGRRGSPRRVGEADAPPDVGSNAAGRPASRRHPRVRKPDRPVEPVRVAEAQRALRAVDLEVRRSRGRPTSNDAVQAADDARRERSVADRRVVGTSATTGLPARAARCRSSRSRADARARPPATA